MDRLELHAEKRTITGKKVRRLRREGWVPAVVYGPGVESRSLQVRRREAEAVLAEAGTSQLVSVLVSGEKSPLHTLVREVQRDPISREVLHIDFYQVEMGKPITVDVPLVLVGESPVVERGLGILLQQRETIEIECLPKDLVEAVEVDLTGLTEVGQEITVADLAIPADIRVLADPDEVLVSVSPVEETEEVGEEEEVEAAAEAEPELIRRRKEEEAEQEQSDEE
ncbi:MAG TPA: 50S ribosomal protein L25 [Anaerolineae bacterium]|nr:50S ribosomal protein L25 [Anaerolineae bacterium]